MEHDCARAETEVRDGTCLRKDGYIGKRWNMLVQGLIRRYSVKLLLAIY